MSQPLPIAEVLSGFVTSIEVDKSIRSNFGLIMLARHQRGLGVQELATLANVVTGTVRNWEISEAKGMIRRKTIERALKAMGTTPDEVLAEINSRDF